MVTRIKESNEYLLQENSKLKADIEMRKNEIMDLKGERNRLKRELAIMKAKVAEMKRNKETESNEWKRDLLSKGAMALIGK